MPPGDTYFSPLIIRKALWDYLKFSWLSFKCLNWGRWIPFKNSVLSKGNSKACNFKNFLFYIWLVLKESSFAPWTWFQTVKKLLINGQILWSKRSHTSLDIHIIGLHTSVLLMEDWLSTISFQPFYQNHLMIFTVLAGYFSHLIVTNIENDPGDGKCSAEFQATEQSVIFEQSVSLSFSVKWIIILKTWYWLLFKLFGLSSSN